uniref:Adrenomedullin 2 n=1 Tax=Podarcis muralis TaxID=64176 RepID=A0A670J6C0_PODMU
SGWAFVCASSALTGLTLTLPGPSHGEADSPVTSTPPPRERSVSLSDKMARMWPAWKPPVVTPGSRLHLSVLPRRRLDPQQPGRPPQHRLPWTPAPRPKRQAAPRLHRAQLMRVGCALGTCQVQNLSHRLWLLKGQLGLQESAPMNPSSPHSYG